MLEQRDGEPERDVVFAEAGRRGLEARLVVGHAGAKALRLRFEERCAQPRRERLDRREQLVRATALAEGQRRLDGPDEALLHGLGYVRDSGGVRAGVDGFAEPALRVQERSLRPSVDCVACRSSLGT